MDIKPLVSVIIVTKNAGEILERCLKKLRGQAYDKNLIEILLLDGGSTDGSLEVAAMYGATVVAGGYPENQEARRYIGIGVAKGEFVLFLDSDNLIPHENWLVDMLKPFERSGVVASFTKWYSPDYPFSAIDTYYALLGGNDPVAYYLGKHDRAPFGYSGLPLGACLICSNSEYDVVKFSPTKLPTIGANGFLVRKSYLDCLDIEDPDQFFHTDIHVDLLKKMPSAEYAIVKNSIIHATGRDLITNIRKRLVYRTQHSERLSAYRRYRVFNHSCPRDWLKLVYTAFVGITFVEPLFRSIIGFCRTKRREWFWHPIATFGMVIAYGLSLINSTLLR